MNSIIKSIAYPIVRLRNCRDNYLRHHNPEKLYCIIYQRVTGLKMNIDNPKTLAEKIAYLSFRTDTTEWSRLADKVAVREYVTELGYGSHLTKLYGVWDNAFAIDFDKLPNSFVLKTNNGCATNYIVKDKKCIDTKTVKEQLQSWLMVDYGTLACEPHYSRIKPLILAEELLIDDNQSSSLIDYKFFCINGTPRYIQVITDRVPNTHTLKVMTYDIDWQPHPKYNRGIHKDADIIERPKSLNDMLRMAKDLSARFPFVRVDFYDINGTAYFGEMTFTPGYSIASDLFQEELGKELRID